jgi:hypothetical protein
MSKRALYSLIPLVLLVGCPLPPKDADAAKPSGAGAGSHGTTLKCYEKRHCRITVTVTACSAAGISANPYTLKVTRRLRDVPIVWTLRAPPGYTFAADGIHFKNKEMAIRQFKPAKASNPHEFVIDDANTEPGEFAYNIRVRHEGRDCPVHDPILINDGDDS